MEFLKSIKREYKYLILIFVLFLLNIVLFNNKMTNLHTDLGRELYYSKFVSEGGVLYRDMFNTFLCPFSYLFNGLVLKFFPAKFSTFYALGAVNTLVILTCVFFICKKFLSSFLSCAVTVFVMYYCCFYAGLMNYFLPYSYAMVYGLGACFVSVFLMLEYLDSKGGGASSCGEIFSYSQLTPTTCRTCTIDKSVLLNKSGTGNKCMGSLYKLQAKLPQTDSAKKEKSFTPSHAKGKNLFLYGAFFFGGIAFSNKYEFAFYAVLLFLVLFLNREKFLKIIYCALSFLFVPAICFFALIFQGLGLSDFYNYFLIFREFVHQPYLKQVYATTFFFEPASVLFLLKTFAVSLVVFYVFYQFFNTTSKKTILLKAGFWILCAVLLFSAVFSFRAMNFWCYDFFSYLPLFLAALLIFKIKEIKKDKGLLFLGAAAVLTSLKSFWLLSTNFYGRYFLPLLLIAAIVVLKRVLYGEISSATKNTEAFDRAVCFVLIFLSFAAFRLNAVALVLKNTPVKTPAGTVMTTKTEAGTYKKLADYINVTTKKSEKIVVLSASPMLNFMTDRESLNFYSYFDEAVAGAYTTERIIKKFEQTRPNYFVVFDSSKEKNAYCGGYGEEICKWLEKNCTLEKNIDGILIYAGK